MQKIQSYFFKVINTQSLKWIATLVFLSYAMIIGIYFKKHLAMIQRDASRNQQSSTMPIRALPQSTELQQFLDQHPVYLVMTSIPKRVKHIPSILQSLDTSKLTEIIIALPHTLNRTGETYHIPKKLHTIDKVRVLRTHKDLGPITKLLPALEAIKQTKKNAIVIVIDDDHFYPAGLVQEYIYALWQSNQKTAFSGAVAEFGIDTKPPVLYAVDLSLLHHAWPDQQPELLHGAYSMGFFTDQINAEWIHKILSFEQSLGRDDCYLSDDLLISWSLRKHGCAFSTLNTPYFKRSFALPLEQNYWADALHNLPLAHNKNKKPGLLTCQHRLNQCLHTIVQYSNGQLKNT